MSTATSPVTPAPRFYFVSEVAAELRRTEASVRWLLHTGQLKAGKIAGRTVVKPEELERFIESGFEAGGAR